MLNNVNGFATAGKTGLTSIGGSLDLNGDTTLTTLAGLAKLSTVGGYFNLQSLPALANLDGLLELDNVGGYFQLWDCDGVSSITGVIPPNGDLLTLGGNLTIYHNAILSQCQADAMRARLMMGGWNKTYNGTTNLPCTSPKTCTVALDGIANAACTP